MNVLLVDDDLDVAAAMRRALEVRGHVLFHAASVRSARKALIQASLYDRVVIDYHLGDGVGTELLPLIPRGLGVCVYSGLPEEVGDPGVPVFSKGDPGTLWDWIDHREGS